MSYPKPPASKGIVRRAGKKIALGSADEDDYTVVDQWRASHGYVLNTFQIWLRNNLKKAGVSAEFAQRLKRRKTVIDKLKRKGPNGNWLISDVTSMHDFAGCRLIFNNVDDIIAFRKHLHNPKTMRYVKHTPKHIISKYNYIENPKPTGYRGIHDVFKHHPRPHRRGDMSSQPWHGLLVEIQYRTKAQHAWATALEISDIIDDKRTKFEHGVDARGQFFAYASEIIARKHENYRKSFLELSQGELEEELERLEAKLGILRSLGAMRKNIEVFTFKKHNVLNIHRDGSSELVLAVAGFSSATNAIAYANQLESDENSVNAVYVRSDNPAQLRSAYRNYFNDPVDFVALLKT